MLMNNRIIFSDNGVLSDKTVELNDIRTGSAVLPVVAAQDYLYLGFDIPANHRYIESSVANDQASVLSIELWDGNEWIEAVDVFDRTAVSGMSLAQSGHISWNKPKNKNWVKEDTSGNVTGLSTLTIYDLYWARFKWSANLKVTTALSVVSQKFSNDSELAGYWPELTTSNTKAQWPTGAKTNWDEQHYQAAEEIVRELKRKGIVFSSGQILNWEVFKIASVHKCAEIIMNSFGKDWVEPTKKANEYYQEAMNLFLFEIDYNKNTLLDQDEAIPTLGVVRR